ncbi:hypothetical protein BX600DRAFT_450339 [Xylariales sp. PMI_506]|nr:hypothetical protein BX600DRAFT_450339 [Xylariales sp. PMI_506]
MMRLVLSSTSMIQSRLPPPSALEWRGYGMGKAAGQLIEFQRSWRGSPLLPRGLAPWWGV